MDDPHLNPPRPPGMTRFLRKAGESTTAFFRRIRPVGSTSVLVGGFLGSAGVASEIIEKGIRGEPLNLWHGIKFVFFFTICTGQSYNLWKTDSNATK